MAIEVGDAILKFIGDSSQLDTKFTEVGPNAAKAFNPAAEVVEQAGQRMKFSMHEARGEVRLLGEEFGIHLPRHVSNFITTLPGVGQAMSAAFSATAVLFIAQALAQATDKLSNFVGNTLIFTEEMRKSNEEVATENKSLDALSKIYSTAKEKLEELNGVTKSWEQSQRDLIQTQIDQAKASLVQMEASIANKSGWQQAKDTMKDVAGTILGQVIPGYTALTVSENEQIALQNKKAAITTITAKALRASSEVDKEEAAKKAKLSLDNSLKELANQKKIALAYAQNDQEKFELEQNFEERKLALLQSYAKKDVASIKAVMTEIEVQQIVHADKISAAFVKMLTTVQQAKVSALDALKSSVTANELALTPLQASLQKAEDAAHSMGITLRTDLVLSLDRAKAAQQAFAASGQVDAVALKAFQAEVKRSSDALDNFGKVEDKFKGKHHNTWEGFQQDMRNGPQLMQTLANTGKEAFNQLSGSLEQAVASAILAQGSFAQAMEKALASALATIAAQAIVKSLFYTGEGFAALAGFEDTSASQYFTAAAVMAAVGAAAGLAGHALAGAGGGGGSHGSFAQPHTSQSNTSQGNRSGNGLVSGVQHFATGGLVSAPTLAVIGEDHKREAVLPLDDPRAMQSIRDGVGGSGGGLTVHVHGLVSDDKLVKIMGKMSKLVHGGKATLVSSNSLRLTKRSA